MSKIISNFKSQITNLVFLFRKPKVVIVVGEGRAYAKKAIFQVLNQYFKIGEDVLIRETELKEFEEFKFLAKHSSLLTLVVTHIGDIPADKDFFAGNKEKTIKINELAKSLPLQGHLILNFDDGTVREIKNESPAHSLTFGFQEGADFRVTDIKLNGEMNFKINYKGNVVPVWLSATPVGKEQKEQIYSALAASAVGTIFGLNLVEISQSLKKGVTN